MLEENITLFSFVLEADWIPLETIVVRKSKGGEGDLLGLLAFAI
jgi:hypothetical protein